MGIEKAAQSIIGQLNLFLSQRLSWLFLNDESASRLSTEPFGAAPTDAFTLWAHVVGCLFSD